VFFYKYLKSIFKMDSKEFRNLQWIYEEIYQDLDEVKGYGGHVDPNTGQSTGKRSSSQQAHATHWDNRRRGKDVPDPRRSKFKYGGSTGSTTGAHQGEPPEHFARNQNPDLATTPANRMKARATSLAAKGKTKQANKIRSVRDRLLNNGYDYNSVVEYLYTEGYALDIEASKIMIENISESWLEEILEARVDAGKTDKEKADARSERGTGGPVMHHISRRFKTRKGSPSGGVDSLGKPEGIPLDKQRQKRAAQKDADNAAYNERQRVQTRGTWDRG
jgi:hypothetical protein